MRFLMKNCLKCAQHCQNVHSIAKMCTALPKCAQHCQNVHSIAKMDFLKKSCQNNGTLISYMDPPQYYVHTEVWALGIVQ